MDGADGDVRCKAVNLCKLGRVINEEAHLLAVFLGEVLLRYLKGLVDILADRNARHYHDEFAPAVMLIELIHGLDIGICPIS